MRLLHLQFGKCFMAKRSEEGQEIEVGRRKVEKHLGIQMWTLKAGDHNSTSTQLPITSS